MIFSQCSNKTKCCAMKQMNLDDRIKAKSSRIYALKGPSNHLFDHWWMWSVISTNSLGLLDCQTHILCHHSIIWRPSCKVQPQAWSSNFALILFDLLLMWTHRLNFDVLILAFVVVICLLHWLFLFLVFWRVAFGSGTTHNRLERTN